MVARLTADDGFRVSDSESSEEEGKGIYAYRGECSFSSVDIESFQEVALSRPELQDASPATLCSEVQMRKRSKNSIGKPNNLYVGAEAGY